ncbi:ABC transporter permease [Yinghuangia seranimata]|uniref:ABC transporter permease n=1 Tax=Yinghuangia seranimata TaxID=408067 RepID=UPI00248B533D|nr:ABC transporter permease [Yinghuangia seranimata]MDI2126533.1 ABC transporter permease [Yinghuangia seranimata]
MSEAFAHTWFMTQRQLRAFLRQPAYLVITLVQPIIWLFLFGALFHKVVDLPGFGGGTDSYIDYLVPGVIVMNAVSANMWAGMGMLEEIERGTLNGLLVTPVRRMALLNANIVSQALSTAIQSLAIIGLGALAGADYAGGVTGLLVLVLVSSVLGCVFGALSNALGMVAGERETIIGINTFLLLPATFLSTAFMPSGLMPHWMTVVARFNPINWALAASRSAMTASPDWGSVLSHSAALVGLAAFAVWLSLRMFGVYRKSV